jgi:hypothetical protein
VLGVGLVGGPLVVANVQKVTKNSYFSIENKKVRLPVSFIIIF